MKEQYIRNILRLTKVITYGIKRDKWIDNTFFRKGCRDIK